MQNKVFEAGSGNPVARSSAPPRIHGVTIQEAAKRSGVSESDLIDFNSLVNPLGPPSSALRAAKRASASLGHYPDPEMKQLRTAISRYFGIKPEQVICGNGSNSLIHLIPRVFRPRKVLVPAPSYWEYAIAAADAGSEVVFLELQERTGFRMDPLDLAFSLKGMDMAFLCNPNNPTGLLTSKTDMLEIVKYALEQRVRLVVDEAFMDFVKSESIVKEAVQTVHLICVRTFSTFFGIPGLRVGYAVSDEATVSALRSGQEPWAVTRAAEQAAAAALDDWRYARRTLRTVQKERDRLLSAIRMIPDVEIFPGSANFIFLKVSASKAPFLTEKLAVRGILVQDSSSFPGLDERFIRIAVKTGRDNKRLIQALRELLNG